ncbi:MAG: helix-turn-helix transcriptional regulator, partial [Dehalococcoidia bacterium]
MLSLRRPFVLVFDDLQWTDPSSLGLLQYAARFVPGSRLLLLGAYRDSEAGRGSPLAGAIEVLRREPGYERILLQGLSEAEVREYLSLGAAGAVPPALAARIHADTDGNPFFIGELLHQLRDAAGPA